MDSQLAMALLPVLPGGPNHRPSTEDEMTTPDAWPMLAHILIALGSSWDRETAKNVMSLDQLVEETRVICLTCLQSVPPFLKVYDTPSTTVRLVGR